MIDGQQQNTVVENDRLGKWRTLWQRSERHSEF